VNDEYLLPGFPGYPSAHIYPLHGPDFKKAKALAAGRHGTAVLYTCNLPPCPQDAQIITNDLKQIGIDVQVKAFSLGGMYGRISTKGEPFDIATIGWNVDYPDPSDFLNLLLDGNAIGPKNNLNFSYFNQPGYNHKLEDAARLTGPARYRAYGALAVDLAKNAAPWAVIENDTSRDFFSTRIGCQTYQPIYGIDLAALCIKH
jgi:ABC-type transport system substrate-binding protein